MRRNKKILLALLIATITSSFYFLFLNVLEDQQFEVYQIIIKDDHQLWHHNDFPLHKAQQFKKDVITNEEDDGYFPVDGRNVCPYLGLRKIPYKAKNHRVPEPNPSCKARVATKEECRKAYDFYRSSKSDLSCSSSEKGSPPDLCIVKRPDNLSTSPASKVKCDLSPCGKNPVFVTSIDAFNGELESENKRRKFTKVIELERHLPQIITKNTKNGLHFCFLQCRSKDGKTAIETILIFPPQATKTEKQVGGLFNINVVVLDSVSRAHFYRSLPKTVKALRDIAYNKSLDVKVLDYQFFQAMGPYTYINLKAFFTGNSLFHAEHIQQKSENQYYYGFDVLYNKFKQKGFRTIFQEDLCWYDVWGSILGNTKKTMATLKGSHDKKRRWDEVVEETRQSKIDDTGVTHATCEVYKHYNSTNPFNKLHKICFGDKTFVDYFFEYLDKSFSHSSRSTENSVPIFAYSHFNIGHEVTGSRVQQINEGFSRYLRKAAEDQNTLTILFSDHGPKSTQYAMRSIEGMYELHSPFLFIILPNKIARIIGNKRVKNLITNQNRLITLKDLNGALSYILENNRSKHKEPSWKEGLFSKIPVNRSCTGMMDYLCVCSGYETWYPDNHRNFTWIAEFALGELNNEIQRLYTVGIRGKVLTSGGGFGKCQKLVGISFTKIRQTKDKKNFFVTMHITTNPLVQVFEVLVKYPMMVPSLKHKFEKETKFLKLLKFRRLTSYQPFLGCKDEGVTIHLCVCKRRKFNDHKRWTWTLVNSPKSIQEVMHRHSNFGANQIIQNLDGDCLYLAARYHDNHKSLAYDIVNTCEKKHYILRISGKSVSKVMTSVSLPFHVEANPLTIKLVLVVYHFRKPLDFTPLISYNITK